MRSILTPVAALALATSCGSSQPTPPDAGDATSVSCQTDARVTTYSPGLAATSSDGAMKATLMSATPSPPANSNNSWMVALTDGSGNPLEGAAVGVVPAMPYMGHGTPIRPVITPQSGGVFQIDDINLYMAGIWEVTLSVTPASGGSAENASFFFCIEG
jgi:hypothetical protein